MTTSSLCYCEDMVYRKCVHCQEVADREAENRICSAWNWNCTPSECADEARELGWTSRQVESAMKRFGFAESHIQAVLFEF